MKLTKTAFAIAFSLCGAGAALAQWGAQLPGGQYVVDSSKSKVVSRVKYLGVSNMKVHFPLVTGILNYDPRNPTAVKLDVNVDASKLDGGSNFNNNQLKGEDFFHTAVHPFVYFRGTSLMYTSPKTAIVDGSITVRNVTKPAKLAVIFNTPAQLAARDGRVALAAATKIKRSDFGMTAWGGAVGENVTLDITVEFVRK